MADELVLIDGTQIVTADLVGGVEYALAVRIDGAVSRATAGELGPALNALYAQALAAVLVDPTLGGTAQDVQEGMLSPDDEAGAALEIEIGREPHTGSTGAFALHLTVPYWQATGTAPQREAVLAALKTVLDTNTPAPGLSVRERVLAAFAAHLGTVVGTVLRNADRPVRATGTPVLVLIDGDQEANHGTTGLTRYETPVAIEVYVPGSSTAALDAQVVLIQQAIRSAGHLGGLALDVIEADTDPEVLRAPYSGPMLAAALTAVIAYDTLEGDPYTEVGQP